MFQGMVVTLRNLKSVTNTGKSLPNKTYRILKHLMKFHTALAGLILAFIIDPVLPVSALAAGCLSDGCHQDMTKFKHMHGPIGAEMAGVQACIMCHTPAGPTCTPTLAGKFKIKAKDICQTCHVKGANSQHANTSTNCLKCHNSHGSNTSPYMLRSKS